MPKVSVIVPNYNHAPYLRQRIDSILNQTYRGFELILLDDCSTDNSRDILSLYKNHPKVTHLDFNSKNSGSTFKQWVKGIELAQGDYIWIAESDDWSDISFLEIVITEMDKRANVGLAFTSSIYFDSNQRILDNNISQNTNELFCENGKKFIEQRFLRSNAVGNASAAVFRKKIYDQLISFSFVEMKYCGDWLFYVQLSEFSDVLYIKKTLNYYRIHNENVSTKAKKSGKHFIEGFKVFEYTSNIKGISIPVKSLYDWAKMYQKAKVEYQFSKELRHSISCMFIRYNPLINIFVFFRIILFYLRKNE